MAITLEEVVQLVINVVRDKEELLLKNKQLEEKLAEAKKSKE